MRRRNLCCCYAVVAAVGTTQLWADAFVQVTIDGFSPEVVSIAPGEAVYWTVADGWGPYSISSDSGAWSPRYLYEPGEVEALQFNQVGNYTYYDAFNLNRGGVHVRMLAPNNPPSVSITSPVDGSVFVAPATFTFSAEATDLDGGLSDVEFYIDSSLIDDVLASPFRTRVTDLAAGLYTLQVVAYDLAGARATSSVAITVQAGLASGIMLSTPRTSAGQFIFQAKGLASGKHVVLESCARLGAAANWTALQTNLATSASVSFAIAVAPENHFFRVIQLP